MSWSGMFKKFGSKGKEVNTYPTIQDTVHAEPVEPSDMVDRERFEVLKAENARLTAQVKKDWQREYVRGYLDGLKRAFNLVDDAEGRPGKRQIADMLQNEIAKEEGRGLD